MGAIFRLSLRQFLTRGRLAIMTVLGVFPILLATMAVRSPRAPSVGEFEAFALQGMLAAAIIPLVVLAIATAAFGNELDDRTLANLSLAPLRRSQIVLPKLLSCFVVAGVFAFASAAATAHIGFNQDARATVAVVSAALAAVIMYSSAFVWLGLASTQAIGFGLAYIVVWEGFFSQFVSGVRVLSISQYAIAFMHGLDGRRFADGPHVGLTASIAVITVVTLGFAWLAVRRLRRMDVP